MKNEKIAIFWNDVRNKLSKVDIKIYLYALGVIAAIVLIIITSNTYSGYSKYGRVVNNKFELDIKKIASDYGINLNPEPENITDYINNEDVNLTEDLGKSLYLTNLYLEQNGLTDPVARGKILSNIIINYQEQLIGDKYTLDNLNIIREESRESLQDYYEDIYNAFGNYGKEIDRIPPSPLEKYPDVTSLDENTFNYIWKEVGENMQKNIVASNNLINALISIPATEKGSEYQLGLINLMYKQTAYYKSLQQIDIDPAKYLIINGETFIENFNEELLSVTEDLYNYFTRFGVKMH